MRGARWTGACLLVTVAFVVGLRSLGQGPHTLAAAVAPGTAGAEPSAADIGGNALVPDTDATSPDSGTGRVAIPSDEPTDPKNLGPRAGRSTGSWRQERKSIRFVGTAVDSGVGIGPLRVICMRGTTSFRTTSDIRGRFELELPRSGNYRFTIEGSNRRLRTRIRVPRGECYAHTFELGGAPVIGGLLDAGGGVIEGLRVRIVQLDSHEQRGRTFVHGVTSDEQGRFHFEHVPEGQFRLVCDGGTVAGERWAPARGQPFDVRSGVEPVSVDLVLLPAAHHEALHGIEADRGSR